LHELQLAKITLRDIATVLTSITNNAGSVTANRVRSSLSTFFAWAMTKGLIQANPVIGTERHDEASRDRVLKPHELQTIWKALPDDHYGDILRLLALIGQRAGEIAGLRWSEVTENAITLPSDRTKNGREHIVPLSKLAHSIIEKQPRRPGRGYRQRSVFRLVALQERPRQKDCCSRRQATAALGPA
jgi:integrase